MDALSADPRNSQIELHAKARLEHGNHISSDENSKKNVSVH